MRILEALRILEDATVECKVRDIDTPDVKEALDLLDPYLSAHMVYRRISQSSAARQRSIRPRVRGSAAESPR